MPGHQLFRCDYVELALGTTSRRSAQDKSLVITEEDIESVVAAGRGLSPAASSYLEEDFAMNLLETVLDYMLQTTVVITALEYFRANRWNDIRTLDDLDAVLARYPRDQKGNTALAVHLWGYRLWTRAQ